MKEGRSNEWIDQLKKNLHAHVKTIGEISVVWIRFWQGFDGLLTELADILWV